MHVPSRRISSAKLSSAFRRCLDVAANPDSRIVAARPIKLNLPSDRRDPGPVEDIFCAEPPPGPGTPAVFPRGKPPTTTAMPLPISPQSLYRNLLFITSVPPPSTSKAVDYYFNWPRALHSTKSFNFLISLALRSASFASVRRLFSAMRAESIPPNMETWKLHTRWFVRTGRWNDAWKFVLEITQKQNVAAKSPRDPIPLPLWLELFGSQKRGALRHWVLTGRQPTAQAGSATESALSRASSSTRLPNVHLGIGPNAGQEFRVDASLEDDGNSPPRRKRLVPRPCHRPDALELSRYRALMQVSPLLTSSHQVQILPRTILIITQMMYQVGQSNLALSTALSYLESLPPRLRRCDRRRALDLVNSHLFMATRHRKPSLKQHFAQRRVLWKFLRARTDLSPSPTTLFILLGPLRGCRRSGTLAMECLRLFEKRWGTGVQSRLVRRRVASLALKEGRLDIVAAMIKLERRRKVFEDPFPRSVYSSRRIPWRILFSRRGVEDRRWHLVEEKYRRRSMLRSEPQGRVGFLSS